MLSNIAMTSGVLGLRFVYGFIVLFKKVILSSLDLVVTMSITACDAVCGAVELDARGIQRGTALNLPLFRGPMLRVRTTGNSKSKQLNSLQSPLCQDLAPSAFSHSTNRSLFQPEPLKMDMTHTTNISSYTLSHLLHQNSKVTS